MGCIAKKHDCAPEHRNAEVTAGGGQSPSPKVMLRGSPLSRGEPPSGAVGVRWADRTIGRDVCLL